MTDIRQIERMTPYEFEIRMTAYQLKRLDEQETIHQQAWVNWQVQSTKKEGKKTVPVFTSFKKFFDKEKLENEILGKKEQTPRFVNS
ncbi:hypothetical protein D931_00017 [Enterococcus faecium 13.SD.W.09]|nr:hypothetical protein D931_00017 [Enterococcus faecium 13.SD.W.09]